MTQVFIAYIFFSECACQPLLSKVEHPRLDCALQVVYNMDFRGIF